jgi:hypothetical protein
MEARKILKQAVHGKPFSENLLLQSNAIWYFGKQRLTAPSKPDRLHAR